MGSRRRVSEDLAESALLKRLREIQQEGRVPLLSIDMDDTFLPFGAVITGRELEILTRYLQSGAHIAFNTLAPKEWFYIRVLERIASTFHRNRQTHLLSRVHWIVSGGIEIFVYAGQCYRRIHLAAEGSKAEGLLHLMRHLDPSLAILALYGDRFDDPGNDGNAIGNEQIPLVINVGADQPLAPRSAAEQIFINTVEKGPFVTLRHLAFITENLGDSPPQLVPEDLPVTNEASETRQAWRFEETNRRCWSQDEPLRVEVEEPGFVWSWDKRGCSHLTTLTPAVGEPRYVANLPRGVVGFTFFWTGGEDARSGQSPGHWEGRDFAI
jgi:hypothetical protein